ncbi:hypothetical protein HAX54_052587 [Datura stramonium]|uniref:Plastocyanin-like domain-containing protein n=1 Tax=Datura stramonium TaxID=4076 RepID=A0ABS8T075_DATST|nr:hypothetical protein [Datura stramonium]
MGSKDTLSTAASSAPADTPLKLADHLIFPGVFTLGSIPDSPTGSGAYLQTSVMAADFRAAALRMGGGECKNSASRLTYNLRDTISRSTVQVYPDSWTALYIPLDNVGMWNIRSQNWARQYLGQQFYLYSLFTRKFMERRISNTQQCPSLWKSINPMNFAPVKLEQPAELLLATLR